MGCLTAWARSGISAPRVLTLLPTDAPLAPSAVNGVYRDPPALTGSIRVITRNRPGHGLLLKGPLVAFSKARDELKHRTVFKALPSLTCLTFQALAAPSSLLDGEAVPAFPLATVPGQSLYLRTSEGLDFDPTCPSPALALGVSLSCRPQGCMFLRHVARRPQILLHSTGKDKLGVMGPRMSLK